MRPGRPRRRLRDPCARSTPTTATTPTATPTPPPGWPPEPASDAKAPRPPSARLRLLACHPLLDAATATGAVSISWARETAGWAGRIDHDELQTEADQILVDAAAAGAGLDDLKLIAQAASCRPMMTVWLHARSAAAVGQDRLARKLAIIKTGLYSGPYGDHPYYRGEGPDR